MSTENISVTGGQTGRHLCRVQKVVLVGVAGLEEDKEGAEEFGPLVVRHQAVFCFTLLLLFRSIVL